MRSLAFAVPMLALAPTARAAEGESSISVAASFAALLVDQGTGGRSDEKTGQGALVGVAYQRGFGDSFWLRVGVGGGAASSRDQVGSFWVGTVGLTYAVDILKYVPYVGLGAGVVAVAGGPFDTHVDPVVDLAAGIEVQSSASFAYGIEARFDAVATKTTLFTIGPRLVWKWGYF